MVTDREMAAEVMRRTKQARRAQVTRRKTVIMPVAASVSLLVIIGIAMMMPSVPSNVGQSALMHSASLLEEGTAGGYVFVGVLAFMLGTLVSWLGLKTGNRAPRRRDDDDDA